MLSKQTAFEPRDEQTPLCPHSQALLGSLWTVFFVFSIETFKQTNSLQLIKLPTQSLMLKQQQL